MNNKFIFKPVKIFITAFLFALILISPIYADANLYKGAKSTGSVKTFDDKRGMYVSLADMAELMGFKFSHEDGEEILITRGRDKLRLILNSSGAWRNTALVALMSAPFERDGIIWLDDESALKLFQNFAGSIKKNKLRFKKIQGVNINKNVESEDKKENLNENKNKNVKSRNNNNKNKNLSESGSAQPKYESFRADKSPRRKKNNLQVHSGIINEIRWTNTKAGEFKKILAVMMLEENSDPYVFMEDGNLHVLFNSVSDKLEKLFSPYENIKIELNYSGENKADLILKSNAVRIDKMILNSPRRVALEFFFSENTVITKISPGSKNNITVAKNPIEEAKSKNKFSKGDPVLMTKPSDLTIPYAIPKAQPENNNIKTARNKKLIVVDPGHGGKDPGARGNGIIEKNINLSIGLELRRILLTLGYDVIMTRTGDTYPSLQDRTDIANNSDADLFVSIHVNALPSKSSMTGFEIYIMALPSDADSLKLAKIENREYIEGKGFDSENVDRRTEMLLKILGDMQQNNKLNESLVFARSLFNAGKISGLPMRRIAQAPFFVIRGSGMPSVLLETGFLTNAGEAANLAMPAYQHRIAQAMANGIKKYLED